MQIIHQAPLAALGLGAACTVLWGAADPVAAFAAVQQVEAEGFYKMGDGMEERMDIAQQMAIEDAVRAAKEKAGVFVEAFSDVRSGQLTRDEIRAITATVLEVKDSKVYPEVVADGTMLRYHAHVVALVDTANVTDFLKRSGEEKYRIVEQNKEMDREVAKVKAEIEKLKEEYSRAAEAERQRINEEVKRNEHEFEANEWMKKGYSLGLQKKYREALECYEKALKLNPDSPIAWSNMGFIYRVLGNYDKAIEYNKKAIELNPGLAGAWDNLGFSYDGSGKYDKAIECYQKASKLNPNEAMVWINFGIAYARLGNYDKAVQCLRKAIELESNMAKAWNNLGWCCYAMERYVEALAAFDKALEINPNYEAAKDGREAVLEKM